MAIVTGGGLSDDGATWRSTKQDYLFPVRVLSKLFRGKLVALLDEARRAGKLKLDGVEAFEDEASRDRAWRRLRDQLYKTRWVSYAKPPFGGATAVYEYLGRYTHRVGLSNHRLLSATKDAVTFRTRGDQTARRSTRSADSHSLDQRRANAYLLYDLSLSTPVPGRVYAPLQNGSSGRGRRSCSRPTTWPRSRGCATAWRAARQAPHRAERHRGRP